MRRTSTTTKIQSTVAFGVLLFHAAVLSFSASLGVLDRFRATCPADTSCIRQFDESLVKDGDESDGSVWVAVYRTNNNKPSVFVRDEFFHAMKDATTTTETSGKGFGKSKASPVNDAPAVDSSKLQTPMALEKPVAVAQLHPSPDFDNKYVLANLRCALKKEDLNEECDGGSEFTEALCVCVDSLILHHLKTITKAAASDNEDETKNNYFEGAIRTKATLFSNKLVEERGFEPVEELSKDMATHVSRYQSCLTSYAERSSATEINPGARDRALQIVSLLGQMPKTSADDDSEGATDDGDDDYDPWASAANMLR